jgi:phosphoadenosine phosphosulfate reductase
MAETFHLPDLVRCEEESLQREAIKLESAHPREIIRWGVERFGANAVALACSFGYEDVALVDMAMNVHRDVDVFYLDTGLLFEETLEVGRKLSRRYGKEWIRVIPQHTLEEQERLHGEELWKRDSDRCCTLRKVEPLRRFLKGYKAWITGIRREQSPTRANCQVVEWDPIFGLVKINPLAHWNSRQVWRYIRERNLPYNPLHDRNYPSIGCRPCTRPVKPGEDLRAGRWAHSEKTECGLHGGREDA